MKTFIKNLLLQASLPLLLTSVAQAQYHYNTIKISSSDFGNANNSEEVSFTPNVNGTATITINLQVFPTIEGALAEVGVNNGSFSYLPFSAQLIDSPPAAAEFVLDGIPTNIELSVYSFELCGGTTYYLSGSGSIYNPLDPLGSPGQGTYSATLSYPALDYTYIINNGTVTITGYNGSGGAVTIPSVIDVGSGCVSDYLPVTTIGDYTFYSNNTLTSITIPNSVTSIGDDVFAYCANLASVMIPNSVTSIGDEAFFWCTSLPSVAVPNSVTSIGDSAFWYCTNLTSVTIPNSVTSIGAGIFGYDRKLNSVTLPSSVTTFGGDNSFFECESLTSVILPIGATSIGFNDFGLCTSLTSITIPNSVTNIGNGGFVQCYNLTNITIPNNVKSIGDDAFNDCPKLATVTIGNSVTSIGTNAFLDCTSLTKVTIGNSVTSIGDYAFSGDSLTNITIPNSVTSIGDYTFFGNSYLTSITIGTNVTSIGDYAFLACYSLTNVTIPNRVTSIGDYTFSECGLLTTITIGNSVTDIADYAFQACYSLTSITIPNSVTGIGDYAFAACYSLTNITIPNSVTNIGDYTFSECGLLTSITIPDSVTGIGANAFSRCVGLWSLQIPSSVASIGTNAFAYCSGLTNVCFEGNAPFDGGGIFFNTYDVFVISYVYGTTGWGGTFSGVSTEPCTQCGSVSALSPFFLSLPQNVEATIGSKATFSVTAGGMTPLTYQWFFDGTNLTDNDLISGSQSNVLTVLSVTMGSVGTYEVIVTNSYGSTNAFAALTVATSLQLPLTVLYTFTALDAAIQKTNSDGAYPDGLILSGSTLFGTTDGGGTNGNGTVFAIDTNGVGFKVLHSFTALDATQTTNSDGAYPNGVILSGNTLYGTASYGGTNGNGTVFAVNTNGTGFKVLHSFTALDVATQTTNRDGAYPNAGLILSGNTLYGTAANGGTNGYGTVFAVNTNGSGFITLHSFRGNNSSNKDGSYPYAGLVSSANTLYGTTIFGGTNGYGIVFALNTDASGFTTLHNFGANSVGVDFVNSDGEIPFAKLILSGTNIYGTTGYGGTNGAGTVFSLATNGSNFKILHDFSNADGANPQAELLLSGNTLFGTTSAGGSVGNGTVFAINTDGTDFTNLFFSLMGAAILLASSLTVTELLRAE